MIECSQFLSMSLCAQAQRGSMVGSRGKTLGAEHAPATPILIVRLVSSEENNTRRKRENPSLCASTCRGPKHLPGLSIFWSVTFEGNNNRYTLIRARLKFQLLLVCPSNVWFYTNSKYYTIKNFAYYIRAINTNPLYVLINRDYLQKTSTRSSKLSFLKH